MGEVDEGCGSSSKNAKLQTIGGSDDPPPEYSVTTEPGRQPPDHVDVTASFATLSLSSNPRHPPTPDTCLAHLKLLHALQGMKEDVGYTDGLWNIWDSRAGDLTEDLSVGAIPDAGATQLAEDDQRRIALSKIREKRWALFVARAVDRYESWWQSLPGVMLSEADMEASTSSRYIGFPTENTFIVWKEHMLPPLDVLMVFHAHMLNPRAFLEDTMRHGLGEYWTAGMPWHLIDAAIDAGCNYRTSAEAQQQWNAQTGRAWANQDDPPTKSIKCPFSGCSRTNIVPWTTCGMDEGARPDRMPGLVGRGYGDGQFSHICATCGRHNSKELLSVTKFVQDAALLLTRSVPMPGTLLDPQTGRPERMPAPPTLQIFPLSFPNRMIQLDLRIKTMELLHFDDDRHPTMATVRAMIEETVRDDHRVRTIDGATSWRRYRLHPKSKVCVRRMMSKYWENFSEFALDLGGAVMRQGVFIEKMCKLDWLHSPSGRNTMQRLMQKYKRFITIMKTHPKNVAVPTLDVDLAWHTHQLSPASYYAYTVESTGKFIDHDDKIDESKLSAAFEWTTKTYQTMFDEIYSECTCWYCETIRSAHISSFGKLLGVSRDERMAESFHKSGAARLCPPDNSAHISAHNAVRSLETAERERVSRYLRARHQEKLERNYEKAAKRAEKKGRKLPPRDQYYNHWGYSYYMYSPYMYPMYLAPGMYYGWDPAYINAGAGAWGSCAAGTCGAGGAGACGAGACGGIAAAGECGAGNGGGCGGGGCGSSGGCGGGGGGGGGCGGGGGGGGGGGCGGGGGGGC